MLSVYRSLSCKWSPSLRFLHLYVFLFFSIHATCEAHLILLDLNTLICCEKYKLWSCSFLRFIQPNLTFSLLCPNIFLSTPLPNTLSLRPSSHVTDPASQPYRATGTIKFPYTLIFMFLNFKLEDRRLWTERQILHFTMQVTEVWGHSSHIYTNFFGM